MNSPIIRMANSSEAVREGFLAAGITVAGVAVLQALAIVLSWIVASVV